MVGAYGRVSYLTKIREAKLVVLNLTERAVEKD